MALLLSKPLEPITPSCWRNPSRHTCPGETLALPFIEPTTGQNYVDFDSYKAEKLNIGSSSGALFMPKYRISNCFVIRWPRAFERKHGNLLSILEVEMQPAAVKALV
ncbi:hypothetical protein CR513_14325, partial [Mucuna pruriens]